MKRGVDTTPTLQPVKIALDRLGADYGGCTMANDADRQSWANWLRGFGAEAFYDSFLSNAQGAQSTCKQCHFPIYLDIVEGGGVPDWKTADGSYGCAYSPDTNEDGTGGHLPITGGE